MSEQIIESPLDGILQEDLISVAESDIPLDALCNSTVLVTGATGLIGSILINRPAGGGCPRWASR